MTVSLDIIMSSQTLSHFIPINSLPDEDIRLLNKQAHFENFRKRELLFVEGSNDTDVLFLVSGSIRLSTNSGDSFILEANSDQARYPIANLKPRRYSAQVETETASVARIPLKILDTFLSTNNLGQFTTEKSIEHDANSQVFDSDWMMAMMKTPLFNKLPSRHIEKLFRSMDEIRVKAGDTIITQGESGDFFYLVKKGKCLITRHNGIKEINLAEIGPTDSFGEEALLSDTIRNASIRMLTNGRLMRLSKHDFHRFMHKPIINWIDINEATLLLKNGAIAVDVRAEKTEKCNFTNALEIPIFMLRNQLKKLSRKNTYILLCDDGSMSSSAAYLFNLRGLETYVLRGGLQQIKT